jgi:putative restriction endonuclease
MNSPSSLGYPAVLECLRVSVEWDFPIFKVLANNDTGCALGHQGGIVVPKDLREFFPELAGAATETSPTVERWIDAELLVESRYCATVKTRYQFQTWGAKRKEERRLTGQLGPLRNQAQGGDVLVMQRHRNRPDFYRLTLVRKTSSEFPGVDRLVSGRRWGVLTSRPPVQVSGGR